MSQVQEAPAAHPFALANGEGERLWFINSEITIKATAASSGGELFLMETHVPAAGRPAEGPGMPPPSAIDIAAMRQIAARYNTEFVGPPLGPS